MTALHHATPAQMEAYTAFLIRLARAAKGRMREWLMSAISELEPWGFSDV